MPKIATLYFIFDEPTIAWKALNSYWRYMKRRNKSRPRFLFDTEGTFSLHADWQFELHDLQVYLEKHYAGQYFLSSAAPA